MGTIVYFRINPYILLDDGYFRFSSSWKSCKSFAGLAIGTTVGLEDMFAGPICGASMNPARSMGPAIVSGTLQHLWVNIVVTILGAVCAAFIYKILHD
ncbi:aquaporin [Peribacillus acanthi]|uniref:aquaporin n=1 Tax=Peribacillus acanthi TaxID=2171554 RepID=UPI001F0C60D7|nr:aquaporin [Peribacillus acanthi]